MSTYLKLPMTTFVSLQRKPENRKAVYHKVCVVLEFDLGSLCCLQLFPGSGKCLAQCPVLLSNFFIIKLLKSWKKGCLFLPFVSQGQVFKSGIWWWLCQDTASDVNQIHVRSHLSFTCPWGSVWVTGPPRPQFCHLWNRLIMAQTHRVLMINKRDYGDGCWPCR